jgi:effector-binding domain-containing protein
MPATHIERSISIKAPAKAVHNVVTDFAQWRAWSPWLITDPETKVTIAPDGKSYTWDGKRTGEGNMKILDGSTESHIKYDLEFLKPWKSQADVAFLLEEKGEETVATWTMDSSLPFFMFWMKSMMETALGMDYDRGLAMLKDYLETGSVPSLLEWEGESEFPGMTFVGIKTECRIDEVGPRMGTDFEKMHAWISNGQIKPVGAPLSQYHKWNLGKGIVAYTAAFPVESIPEDLPAGSVSGTIPRTSMYVIKHTGPYHHIGNAWSTGQAMQRAKEFQSSKSVHPFELYVSMPGEVDEKDLVTKICFPLR